MLKPHKSRPKIEDNETIILKPYITDKPIKTPNKCLKKTEIGKK